MNIDSFLLWFYGLEPKYHINDYPYDMRFEDITRYASFYG